MKTKVLIWTIQGERGSAKYPIQEFTSKAQAVHAMEAQRMPKTAIFRDGRFYRFTMKGD